jgi:hypothetical protein
MKKTPIILKFWGNDEMFHEQERFSVALTDMISATKAGGIGTLGEKTLHNVLKHYYEPNALWHEVKVGKYVADIMGKEGIIEIQTRNFSAMRKKLEYLLQYSKVTVVFPVPHLKWVQWIDLDTGEITKKHKSPKIGTTANIFSELVRIKPLLLHENLSFRVCLMDMEETRCLNGWSQNKKRGSSRCDRIPLNLLEEVILTKREDYKILMPQGLSSSFTSQDFRKLSRLPLKAAQNAVNVLAYVGVIKRDGKLGRLFLYKLTDSIHYDKSENREE